eukprot:gene2856-2789_t
MLVMLIIFLITIPVVTTSIPVSLPKERVEIRQSKPENIIISVDTMGGIYWYDQKVANVEALVDKLKKVSTVTPQPEVQIRGDMASRYEGVGKILSGSGAGDPEVMMDINTTPLIDVMLVLLVMLIITIPIQLHSVNLDMPVGTPPTNSIKPEKIQIDIDENSVVYWQGQAVSAEQLEAKMASIGQLVSQPEVHIRPNKASQYAVFANDPSRRYKGIAIVVALHILIGWAIVSGTAKNALVALKKPLEAVVIQE